jgi:hypothetical protein
MNTSYKGNLKPQIQENIEKAVWKNKDEIKNAMKNMYSNIMLLFNFYFDEKFTADGTKDL